MKNRKQWYWVQFFIFLVFSCVYASDKDIHFQHITINDGLSQNSANCLLRDKKGFMWFGTQDGLNRFDGYEFTVYRNDPMDSTSISDNYILSMIEDYTGAIWVGTQNGLNRFSVEKEIFKRYCFCTDSPYCLCDKQIKTIHESFVEPGILWIGTENGLSQLNVENEQVTNYFHDTQ